MHYLRTCHGRASALSFEEILGLTDHPITQDRYSLSTLYSTPISALPIRKIYKEKIITQPSPYDDHYEYTPDPGVAVVGGNKKDLRTLGDLLACNDGDILELMSAGKGTLQAVREGMKEFLEENNIEVVRKHWYFEDEDVKE